MSGKKPTVKEKIEISDIKVKLDLEIIQLRSHLQSLRQMNKKDYWTDYDFASIRAMKKHLIKVS